jgi:hypothetical protein
MRRLTECFSMYSDMSMRTMARSSSKRKSARLPGQLGLADAGGAEEQERADGPVGVGQPARLRRMALATAATASSWPTTRSWRTSSRRTSLAISPSMSRDTGTPVHLADDLGDVLLVDLLLQHLLLGLELGELLGGLGSTWRSSSGSWP